MRDRPTLVLAALLSAGCAAYLPPSGAGYDYDRGRAAARNDVRAGRLVYFLSEAEQGLLASRRSILANCGVDVAPAPGGAAASRAQVDYVRGYNGVSVPTIEQRLGTAIDALSDRCARPQRDSR